MKRILLVTLYGCNNLGNRLQHVALQQVLEELGCEVTNLIYDKYYGEAFHKELIKSCLNGIGVKKYSNYTLKKAFQYRKRLNRFRKFSDKYIHNQKKISFYSAFEQDWSEYDRAVTGSDQVWHNWHEQNYMNNGMEDKDLEYFYLMFMPKEKRVAYAPSFGFSEFPMEDIECHKCGLSEIAYLSCREAEGAKIIKEFIGREAKVVLDPTLLLTDSQWRKLGKKPQYKIPLKYMVVYFLGDITDEYRKAIINISEEEQLEIINVYDVNDLRRYATTPDEFVWLIEHSEYVCTDSFHACVFSIVFSKRFMAFHRKQAGFEKMFARISDLLQMTGLENHEYNSMLEYYPNIELEMQGAHEQLEKVKRESYEYLRDAIECEIS